MIPDYTPTPTPVVTPANIIFNTNTNDDWSYGNCESGHCTIRIGGGSARALLTIKSNGTVEIAEDLTSEELQTLIEHLAKHCRSFE